MNQKNIKILIILYLISITSPIFSKIKKRIVNGTVYYYNVPEYKTNKKIKLSTKYDSIIKPIAKEHNIDYKLIKCIIQVESNFKANAVSDSGAMGLMQLMQDTGEYYNMKDPFDPKENITIGIKHFKGLYNYFKGDIPLALAAYHAGLGRVKKNMSVPPIKSTMKYVEKIMNLYNGKNGYKNRIKKLYKRIKKDGTIVIYSK